MLIIGKDKSLHLMLKVAGGWGFVFGHQLPFGLVQHNVYFNRNAKPQRSGEDRSIHLFVVFNSKNSYWKPAEGTGLR